MSRVSPLYDQRRAKLQTSQTLIPECAVVVVAVLKGLGLQLCRCEQSLSLSTHIPAHWQHSPQSSLCLTHCRVTLCIFVLASPALQGLRRGEDCSPKILQTGAVSPICSAFGTEGGSKPCSVQKARQTDIYEEQIPEANFTQDASVVVLSLC